MMRSISQVRVRQFWATKLKLNSFLRYLAARFSAWRPMEVVDILNLSLAKLIFKGWYNLGLII